MMNREEQVEKLTTYIAHFTDYIGKHLGLFNSEANFRISRGGDKPACKVHL